MAYIADIKRNVTPVTPKFEKYMYL